MAQKMLQRPGLHPDPAEGAYSAPPDPLAEFVERKQGMAGRKGWGVVRKVGKAKGKEARERTPSKKIDKSTTGYHEYSNCCMCPPIDAS